MMVSSYKIVTYFASFKANGGKGTVRKQSYEVNGIADFVSADCKVE